MRAVVLYSGGKDSNHALWEAVRRGVDVVVLLSFVSKNSESWMFHYPNIEYTRLQSECLGIPLVSWPTAGEKEKELLDLEAALRDVRKKFEVDSVISGAIESEYQRSRIERLCSRLGLSSLTPLWHRDPERLILEEIETGFETMVTACMALGLTKEWLGRRIDCAFLEDLKILRAKYGIHLSFEGGEGETFVLDSPLFKDKIKILESTSSWRVGSGYYFIRKAERVPKI